MGDRGNIAVIQDDKRKEQVWLYSHWGGYKLPARLQAGLAAGTGRYGDYSYLTKIIFGHAVPTDNWTEEAGHGISTHIQDNEHPILVVDIPNKRVFTMEEGGLKDGRVPLGFKPAESWTFAEYVALRKLPWSEAAVVSPEIN